MFEVCVDNIFSVRNAFNGGADRIELCSALSEGGLTPSVGFLKSARKETRPDFPIFVMIRPRGGDFVYDSAEVDIMEEDINNFKRNGGADGFVFGLLTRDKRIDVENCSRLLEAAKPLPVTFHRAFDELDRVDEGLDAIIELGFARLLTSGGAATAEEGVEVISRLVERSNGRLIIMPGSGVMPANLRAILTTTGAKEFHGSTKGARNGNGIVVASEAIAREMKEIGAKVLSN